MEEASPSTSWIPCALATGCTLHAWHKGMCNIVLNKKCREKKQATIWVAADEPQQKKRPRADGGGHLGSGSQPQKLQLGRWRVRGGAYVCEAKSLPLTGTSSTYNAGGMNGNGTM